MRFVFWVVGLFALAVLIGLASTINTGYAILFVPPYRMEVSFNFLILAIVLLILIAYGVLRLLGIAANLPHEVRTYQRQRKLKASRHALREAAIAMFEGRFQRAEREALKSIDDEYSDENRGLALMIAARSAASVQDLERRDGYLARLEDMPERIQLARHMLEAQIRLDGKQPLEALAAVERARAISSNLTSALRLELKIRLMLKQPEHVLTLTEKLLKADALEAEQARRYRLAAYRQQLASFSSEREIRDWLKRIPGVERQNPALVADIANQLIKLDAYDMAAELIAGALSDDEQATPELARELGLLAGHIDSPRRLTLLRDAENWLKSRPRDHLLLLSLGRLAHAEQLWGKAQNYLEASLSIQPTLCAHAELAKLLLAIDKPEKAERHYQDALKIALENGC
ncbi:heme biosynthesis HemY N-terminal domain-containing protein [Vogesella indigofera]|uniref:heme biosynthesis HemY N-terminal domain-containing protein n=1 Tax=Vogesella indigofera TaxID=45465 RepID=UPI00234E985C|nr:heme biosynthesis HemY N-terminal domain-containing protein [Vogesella indigofera]MDC7708509.1 heme biosynthesis HemY N-terminal domain-containing protein [Vogesella indigofera]